jgi:hypothetical protein
MKRKEKKQNKRKTKNPKESERNEEDVVDCSCQVHTPTLMSVVQPKIS